MKKIIIALCFVLLSIGYLYAIGSKGMYVVDFGMSDFYKHTSGTVIDNNTYQAAFKINAPSNMSITKLNMYMDLKSGADLSSTNFTMRIETDDGTGIPSGSVVGAPTAEFAGITADGWTGEQTLATPTGALTPGVTYWAILNYSSGVDLNSTNNFSVPFIVTTGGASKAFDMFRLNYNGSAWVKNTAPHLGYAVFNDSSIYGYGFNGSVAGLAISYIGTANRILSNQTQGIKFQVNSNTTLEGISWSIGLNSVPGNMFLKILTSNGTELRNITKDDSAVKANSYNLFDVYPQLNLTPGLYYALLFQDSATNGYELRGVGVINEVYNLSKPEGFNVVYGNLSSIATINTSELTTYYGFMPYGYFLLNSTNATFCPACEGGSGGGSTVGYGYSN